jgi:CheY-like chemotaxis protein
MPNILIIDDEDAIVLVIKEALENFGFNVEIATDGLEGIRKYGEDYFDLVITDIRMPGLDGYGVSQQIRNFNKKNTPIIGISGTPWLLKDKYFDAVLEKPFSIKTLINIIFNLTKA